MQVRPWQRLGNVIFFLSIYCFAQPVFAPATSTLFPIWHNGKMGYIDRTGKTVVEAKFELNYFLDRPRHFVEGLQPMSSGRDSNGDEKYGYVNTRGEFVIEPQFSFAGIFADGLAPARSEDLKWGYINTQGQYVIPPQFEDVEPFSEGLALVGINRRAGYIDKQGTLVIPPRFSSWSPQHSHFSEGLACVAEGDRWGFINKTGQMVIPAQFKWAASFSEGLAPATLNDRQKGTGYIDRTGKFVIPPQFSSAGKFSEGLAQVVTSNGDKAFINKEGKEVFSHPSVFWALDFSEGLVCVQVQTNGTKLWGYLDRTGKWVIEPRFAEAHSFYGGLAQVRVETNRLAYIDKVGRYVWGPEGPNEKLEGQLALRTTDAERAANNREIIRLSQLISPQKPPVTEAMLTFRDPLPHDISTTLRMADPQYARPMAHCLLKVTCPPNNPLAQISPTIGLALENEFRNVGASLLIEFGDPAIVPVLRGWLEEALKSEELINYNNLPLACRGLTKMGDRASLPVIRKFMLSPLYSDESRRNTIASTLAELAALEDKPTLLQMLKDVRLNEPSRCKAAATLVRLGDSNGREYLLKQYRRYLDALGKDPHDSACARHELEFLGDAQLIAALQKTAGTLPPGVPRNNVNTLLDQMVVNALPLAALKQLATDTKWENLGQRYQAIQALEQTDDPKLLPFLKSLQTQGNVYPDKIQNQMFSNHLRRAIQRIQQRSWQQAELK